MQGNAETVAPKAPEVVVRGFTDFIEINQEVAKRPFVHTIVVTAEQARSLAADLLKAAQQYDGSDA